jgi:glycosyltransferase involved in cell wall biosynthesis
MKILFASEYFPPNDVGGAEWSAYWQAKNLAGRECDVFVATPRYNKKKYDDSIKTVFIPFFPTSKLPVRNYILENAFWYIWSGIWIAHYVKRFDIDIIHAQNKHMVPGAIIARALTGKKVVASVRDYSFLCHYGFCLWKKNNKHTLREYFIKELPFFLKNYRTKAGFIDILTTVIGSIFGLMNVAMLNYFLKRADYLVFISQYISEVYKKNNFTNASTIIYNLPPQISDLTGKIQNDRWESVIADRKIVLFVGKLSLGKGAIELLRVASDLQKTIPEVLFVFAGKNSISDKYLSNLPKNTLFLGKISQLELEFWYSHCYIVCIPSIWPEPFGRVAIEALRFEKPIISSGSGGLAEILKNTTASYMIDVRSHDAFRDFLSQLLKKKKLPKNFQKNKQMMDDYIIREWIKVYKNYGKKI